MSVHGIVWGPTYSEMLDPSLVPPTLLQGRPNGREREPSGADLFGINWRDEQGRVRVVRLPTELTGVEANILVLIGKHFPSGSHKIGPAYAALMEAELEEQLRPGSVTLVAPSTGNFAIGAAYVARAKGYEAVVVMPEGLTDERYERVRRYGARIDLMPNGEGDLRELLRRTHDRYAGDPGYRVLAQFEAMANYRFHRFVTGGSILEAAAGFGDARVAAFVAAPGSAGTLAAGDEIKAHFDDALVVAVEPRECPFLACSRRGKHRIEGIGDGIVSLIHNVLNTDYAVLVAEEDCLWGLRVIQEGAQVLTRALGVPEGAAESLVDLFGLSGVCNILGAIRVARSLNIPSGRNIVTVATDGFDRYPSAMAGLERESGHIDQAILRLRARLVFSGGEGTGLCDLRGAGEKERLHREKEALWSGLGYPDSYLRAMRSPSFWEEEYARVAEYDRLLRVARGTLPEAG
ncbi:MAG: pyridoxal-phosphate dependent enzyme [Anaerolineae bacterium]|nr:pyridoxal-phosphate dependent enzyme [Anaerolineae bacterium]